jgi:ABC-type multidrug transport system ATPase subunit
MGPSVYFRDVTVVVEGVQLLGRVNAVIPGGSVTALIGPNGAGKTSSSGEETLYRQCGIPE